MRKIRTLEHWKGALSILIATATPMGAYATGEASLRAAVTLGVIAGLTATYNWIDTTLAEVKMKARARAQSTANEEA